MNKQATAEKTGEELADITGELNETENRKVSRVLAELFRWTLEPQTVGGDRRAASYRTRIALRTAAMFSCLTPEASPHRTHTALANELGVSKAVLSFHARRAQSRIAKGFDVSRN